MQRRCDTRPSELPKSIIIWRCSWKKLGKRPPRTPSCSPARNSKVLFFICFTLSYIHWNKQNRCLPPLLRLRSRRFVCHVASIGYCLIRSLTPHIRYDTAGYMAAVRCLIFVHGSWLASPWLDCVSFRRQQFARPESFQASTAVQHPDSR